MKKLLCLCLILPLFVSAQSHSNKIYFEFEDTEGTNTFSFSKMMLDAIDITTEDDDGTLHHVTGDLHKVKFLNFSEEANIKSYSKLNQLFENSKYTMVDFENEDVEGVKIYIEKKGRHISEVHLLLDGFGEGSLVSLYGKLKAKELCAISEALNLNACKHLKHVK